MLYGTYELKQNLNPLVLPMNDVSFFKIFSPVKGKLQVEADRSLIRQMMEILKPRLVKKMQIQTIKDDLNVNISPSCSSAADPLTLGTLFNSYVMVVLDSFLT